VSTQSATAAGGTLFCSVRYATIAAKPSGFAVGNCPSGTHMHRQMKSDATATGTYDGGKVFGNFAGCGWIRNDQRNAFNFTDQWTDCDATSIGYNQSEYQLYVNGAPWTDGCTVVPGGPECKGTPIDNRKPCAEVGNVRPWASGQVWSDPITEATTGAWRVIPAHATFGVLPNGQPAPRFAWRYVARYPTTDGNYWVMGRDRATAANDGTWVFVPYNCL
jgi:hypothetical protein